jgi:Cell division protein CrgA
VPKSRVRQKAVYTPPPPKTAKRKVGASWIAPAMVTCLLVGLAWIVLSYTTSNKFLGMSAIGSWNLVIGFAFIITGVVLATQWR